MTMYKIAKSSIINVFMVNLTKSILLCPLFPLYHITPLCNLKCAYCEGLGPSYQINPALPHLSTDEAKELLRIIRRKFDMLFLTGGEPCVREDFSELALYAKERGFSVIAVNTNSLLLPQSEESLKAITHLVISIDSLDEASYDRILGIPGAAGQIRENALRYTRLRRIYGYKLSIHCVVMPDRLGDAYAMLDFCLSNSIPVRFSPQTINLSPHPDLIGNIEYQRFIRKLIHLKKQTRLISGTSSFLNTILSFKQYRCHPFMIPRIFPKGELLYPCRLVSKIGGNLLSTGSWDTTVKRAVESFGLPAECYRSCQLPCYIEPSLIFKRPWEIVSEFTF